MATATVSVSSTYELERNKPMPNRIHGLIQARLIFLFYLAYQNKYQFVSETSLDITPDICMFPIKQLSLKNAAARETEAPITTIEIQSPLQSIDELINKAWNLDGG